jgi:tellurite resistance protein
VVDQLGAIADALGGSGVDTSAILDDLKEIAEADGKFDDDEKAMIAGLEKLWA